MLCCDQVDADYIEQALEIFGRYDEDGDGQDADEISERDSVDPGTRF